MTNPLAIAFGFVVVGGTLLAVVGAVKARERFAFVGGVVLLAAGPVLAGGRVVPAALAGLVAVVGVLSILASTVPLLRQSPAST